MAIHSYLGGTLRSQYPKNKEKGFEETDSLVPDIVIGFDDG